MPYSQPWNSRQPGCLILLLDQSGSMDEPFGLQQAGGGRRKCEMLATVVNGFLNELITANTVIDKNGMPEVRPRAEVAILGYSGTSVTSALKGGLGRKEFVTLGELQDQPLAVERRKKRELDETGTVYEVEVSFPIWVKPVAGQGTPMCAALRRAAELAQRWAAANPQSYPPVVINVTDGMSTDGDPTAIAQDLCRVATADGQALLFTVHLTNLNSAPVEYPATESELPNDPYAQLLFRITSPVPETSLAQLSAMLHRDLSPGARGLIFNGDAVSVRLMFNFASIPATQLLDPNR
ncbi:VWA domain-containing protein [Thermogemmatispora tikiterensis]|uniref:VWFA domain-containing protein n=1 Tax=Thermogemmatispora tikiterensis TaxID=1825093 RepID=A0A328VJL1_9CHLR|nr:VWA domain-containing protein [Thermogemmatispora tikiterensis]RAQ97657.1 hypothetical protein A4R35_19115 [Thermogemmatispora tikiterensis]